MIAAEANLDSKGEINSQVNSENSSRLLQKSMVHLSC